MSKKRKKLPTESEEVFGSNPFGDLKMHGLSMHPSEDMGRPEQKIDVSIAERLGKGERLEVRREKSGRGGKTVTTVKGFPPRISQDELIRMLKGLKSQIGTGGGLRDGQMEIQGDKRSIVCNWLLEMGFKPVLAGG